MISVLTALSKLRPEAVETLPYRADRYTFVSNYSPTAQVIEVFLTPDYDHGGSVSEGVLI